jgi:hyaluronoglucosaminidase
MIKQQEKRRPENPVGVIEGFFGKPWSWDDRAAYAAFLSGLGFGFYIYAPKQDRYLRQNWRKAWPETTAERAAAISRIYRDNGLKFGIGLSPFELHRDDKAGNAAALRRKARELNRAAPDILCIQFDDMRGATPDLAEQHARIVDEICNASTAGKFIVCPTYYSFDPILEKIFGAAPDNYLADLGRLLDPRIDIFWTGPHICSRRYPTPHLARVAELLRRHPFLWDNYPVNDSAAMAPFLHLGPFRDRPRSLRSKIAGHAVNPMNQPWLSRIPLCSLADSYAAGPAYDPDRSFVAACNTLCGAELGRMVIDDADLFQETGLAEMKSDDRNAAIERYRAFGGNPYANEILGWLKGNYTFDPACLL